MKNVNSLNHSRWECKYHITWIPKYRKKKLFGELRQYLCEVLRSFGLVVIMWKMGSDLGK